MSWPWVSRRAYDVLAKSNEELLAVNAVLRIQVERLTDSVAAVNRIPAPFRSTGPKVSSIQKIASRAGIYQRQKQLERSRRIVSED